MIDPTHWLWRLDAAEWIAAARSELVGAQDKLGNRRAAVVHCRRGAGMALNAVLVAWARTDGDDDGATTRWGRSYVDHLDALAAGDRLSLPEDAVALAAEILAVPTTGREVATIGRGPNAAVRRLVEQTAALVDACARAALQRV